MKPTIDDIARVSGVSKGTVSRVINGHASVAMLTRERVQDVMRQLGYQPDPAARQLSWRTGRTLGISVLREDPLLSPYQVLFHRAIEREIAPLGLALADLGDELEQLSHLPSAMLVMHVREGDPRLPFLRERGVPTVLVGHHPGWSFVVPDDRGGAAMAARHLGGLGHRELLFLGAGESQVARDRQAGFDSAAAEVGARVRAVPCEFTVLAGYRAMRGAWEEGLRPSGVFAGSDECAVGAMAALMDLGVRVPVDVSVVGFDGLPELPSVNGQPVRLTTVAQDIGGIAAQALALVFGALAGEPSQGKYVPVRFVPGETTAPPGKKA